jgi:hypothetical protein
MRFGSFFGIACVAACGGRLLGDDGASVEKPVDAGLSAEQPGDRSSPDSAACDAGDCAPDEDHADTSRAPSADAASSVAPCDHDAAAQHPLPTPAPPTSTASPWPAPPPQALDCIPSQPTPGLSCCTFACCAGGICQDTASGAICCNPQGAPCDAVNLCCPGLSCTSSVCR